MPFVSAVPDSQRLAPPSLWRDADFRSLWAGQTASQFGEQASLIVLPLIAVLTLNADAAQLGVLRAVGQAPILLFSLFVGAWVDRWRTRTVMMLADLGRALALSACVLAGLLGGLGLPALLVAAFVTGSLSVFFDVGYQASLMRLVQRHQLVQGNSALEGSRSAAQIGGATLGGLLVTLFPASIAAGSSAPFFALSFLSIRRIRHESVPERPQGPRRVWRQVHEGLRFVGGNPSLRTVGLASAAFQFFFAAMMTVYLLFLTRELHLAGSAVGLALAATGPGALLGSLLAARLPSRFGYGTVLVSAAALGDGAMLCVPALHGPAAVTIPALVAVNFVFGDLRPAGQCHGHGRPAGHHPGGDARPRDCDHHICRNGTDPARLAAWGVPRAGVGVARQPPGDGCRHDAVPGTDGFVPARPAGKDASGPAGPPSGGRPPSIKSRHAAVRG